MQRKQNASGVVVQRGIQLMDIYLKLVALVLLAFAIRYWARLIGLEDPVIGFDTIATQWQIALGSLVVLLPVAALGLWCNTRWGVVIWILVIAVECSMYGFFRAYFGKFDQLIIFHAVSFSCFVLAKLLLLYGKHRLSQQVI